MSLSTLFNPRSVAVIGASSDPSKVGYALLKNIVAGDASREIFPITLNAKEILGKQAYTSIAEVPDEVDLAVIAVRADIVPKVLHDCAHAGVTAAVVITAGFKEVGEEGKKLEDEIAGIAEKHGITLLGPNCLGVMNTHTNWNASFAVEAPQKGGISFVSQSGAIGTALLDWANREGVGFAKFVSLGNEAALDEIDFLEYLADDPETSAVLMYVENIANGGMFMKLAKRLTDKKPLVVLQAGTSVRGGIAVSSHTGSLAPSSAVFEAAAKQSGVTVVHTLRELFSIAKLFAMGITEPKQNLVILTNGGGPSVNATDILASSDSLSLVAFSDETKEALRAVLPPMAAVNNPIDAIGDAGPDRYDGCLKTLTTMDDVDAVLTLVTPQMMTNAEGIADVLLSYRAKKPIIPIMMGGRSVAAGVQKLIAGGLVNFEFPSDAITALDKLTNNAADSKKKVESNTHKAANETLTMLHLDDMREVLGSYNIHLAGEFVSEGSGIDAALEKLGEGPYAMKAISQELVHKSDLKAVQLHLESKEALEHAWEEIYRYVQEHTPGAIIDGMLIQKMVTGQETIIGMKRDSTFGPVIVFGLGGIFVEILKDASMRVAPITKEEALLQIQEIQGIGLLTGARGREKANLDALAEIIVALSTLALEHPEIQEIDFNPVFATPEGAYVVDARVMV